MLEALALASRNTKVDAVAAVATPVPVGIPLSTGVVIVGVVPNTNTPVPVSSVTAASKFALEGVARKVATPVPNPLTPVEIGNPVQFVNVPDVGMPNKGVTNVGDVLNTSKPLPVSSDIKPSNCKDVVAAKTLRLSVYTATVLVTFGKVSTLLVVAGVHVNVPVTPAL